jgi:hypothetical protein
MGSTPSDADRRTDFLGRLEEAEQRQDAAARARASPGASAEDLHAAGEALCRAAAELHGAAGELRLAAAEVLRGFRELLEEFRRRT